MLWLFYIFSLIIAQCINLYETINHWEVSGKNLPTGPICGIYLGNIFGLLVLVFIMKFFNHGINFLAFGFVTIVAYNIVLIYLIANAP